mgnify:CR=1 FL=1
MNQASRNPHEPSNPDVGLRYARKRFRISKLITGACILECDSQHGEVEKYDKRGKHLGAFDPKSGKQLKDPIKNRRIEL